MNLHMNYDKKLNHIYHITVLCQSHFLHDVLPFLVRGDKPLEIGPLYVVQQLVCFI